jgi:hypothetical protein
MTTKTVPEQRTIRVVADLIVDEDIWDERVQEGSTDKFLVSEVRKTLRIDHGSLCYDVEIQDVQLLEKGGNHGQVEP